MKIAVELIEGLRYKLRMMGVPVEDPCNVFCDNEAVVKNSTRPESTLKKKHQAIAYHRTREAQAARTVRIAKEDGETNLADILQSSWQDRSFGIYHSASYGNWMAIWPVKRVTGLGLRA
jgi:hypothetical protein